MQEDLDAVMDRAREAGVSAMIAPATDLKEARFLLDLSERHADVWVAVGVHPCEVQSVSGRAWIDELHELARHPKVAAIGEIGLDYFHPPAEGWTVEGWRQHQAEVLVAQLEVAAEHGLNTIIHNRESWEDLTRLVLPFSEKVRGQFHCFTGTAAEAQAVIERGHLVSFTGIVTFKKPGNMAETAVAVPADAYLLETDAPFMAPVPHRGQRCEPAYVADTGRCIAALRGVPPEQVAEETSRTARAFFRGL
ncbi:MAG: TatD family hydrolase [Verrucomicrobiales bacterium]|nr:TatD family hydrolase [Verrucomicrobiales bacterium]